MIAFACGEVDPRRWRTFENLAALLEVGSTNDLARELIELYFEEEQMLAPSVLVAEGQPQARGRNARWEAPRGRGIYLTFVRRAQEGEPLSLVPIAVARWLREAVAESTGVKAELKWPNDLYVGRRKVAGVLTESRTQGDETYLAVGIGLNVAGSPEALGVPRATTLEQEAGRKLAIAPLLQALLDRFDCQLADPEWESEVGKWEMVSLHHRGDRLTVRREGSETTGEYQGLSPEGFLRLKTAAGETVISTGEVAAW